MHHRSHDWGVSVLRGLCPGGSLSGGVSGASLSRARVSVRDSPYNNDNQRAVYILLGCILVSVNVNLDVSECKRITLQDC